MSRGEAALDEGADASDADAAQVSPTTSRTADDVLSIQRFFRLYRSGALPVSRVRKPRGLAIGGSMGALLEESGDLDGGAEASFFEAHGYMRPLAPTDVELRLGVISRLRLPEIALNAPALMRCARLAVKAFGLPNSIALVNIVGDHAVTTVASHATASYAAAGYAPDSAGYDSNLCAHASVSEEPVYIDNLRDDWRFAGTQKVRTGSCTAYYGVPLFLRVGVLGGEAGGDASTMPNMVRRSSDETAQSAGTSSASTVAARQRVQVGSLCIASSEPQSGREVSATVERRMRALGELASAILEGLVAQTTLVRDIAVRTSLDQLLESVGRVTEQQTTPPDEGTVMTRTPHQTPQATPELEKTSAPPFGLSRSASSRSRPPTPRQATLAATYSAHVDASTEAKAVAALSFSEAADMLRAQLNVAFVVVLDLRDLLVETLPDGGYETRVLGASIEAKRDEAVWTGLASAHVGALLREAVGVRDKEQQLVTLSDGGASAIERYVFRGVAALLDLVVTDSQGALQFAMIIGSFERRMRFGPEELSIARVVGTVLLSRLSVSRLLDSSAAGAAFVSQASHDLRSPLYGLLAQLESIRAEAPSSALNAMRATLDTAEVCGLTLRETLDDVLEIQRLGSSPHVPMALVETDLARALKTYCTVALARHQRRLAHLGGSSAPSDTDKTQSSRSLTPPPATMSMELEGRPSWTAMVSAPALRRIVLSVLDNALKFCAAPGTIRVRMVLVDVEAETGAATVDIVVEDQGIGMDEAFVKAGLWKPFVRATSKYSGAGLGMPISAALTRRLAGAIDVQSVVGQGTTVTVSIPVKLSARPVATGSFPLATTPIEHRPAAQAFDNIRPASPHMGLPTSPRSNSSSPSPGVNSRKLRVLCVDDSSVALKLLTALCAKHGVDYASAEDGQQAVDKFREAHFDVVLSDLTMPNLNGIEAAREMRAIEAADRSRRRSMITIISAAAESAICPPEIDAWKVKGSFRLASIRDLLTQQQDALDKDLARG